MMKHFLLKWNHGVEIGARLAYQGHARKTQDSKILIIAEEELQHRLMLHSILLALNCKPSPLIDLLFTMVGNTIYWLCQISPRFLLNFVARMLEITAISNYEKLATMYPRWKLELLEMALTEEKHELYFASNP